MPLIPSASRAAMSQNIAEMVRAGHARAQSIAAAYHNARQHGAKFAGGGASNFFANRAFSELHAAGSHPPGLIASAVPGRTDRHSINVPSGSYIMPADHVSSLGEGNTLAGSKVLDGMFKAPGMTHLHSSIPRPPSLPHFARGGAANEGRSVPIIVAGGEYLLHPDQVRHADEIVNRLPPGHGDLKRGHDALDHWVVEQRKKHRKTLAALPAPKK